MSGVLGALAWNRTVTLTNTQIQQLPSTGIEVIPAPGAGIIAVPIVSVFKSVIVGAYSSIDATQSSIFLIYNTTGAAYASAAILDDSTDGFADLSTFLGAFGTGTFISTLGPSGAASVNFGSLVGLVAASTKYLNLSVIVKADNLGTGNYSAGNSSNSLTIVVSYLLIEV